MAPSQSAVTHVKKSKRKASKASSQMPADEEIKGRLQEELGLEIENITDPDKFREAFTKLAENKRLQSTIAASVDVNVNSPNNNSESSIKILGSSAPTSTEIAAPSPISFSNTKRKRSYDIDVLSGKISASVDEDSEPEEDAVQEDIEIAAAIKKKENNLILFAEELRGKFVGWRDEDVRRIFGMVLEAREAKASNLKRRRIEEKEKAVNT